MLRVLLADDEPLIVMELRRRLSALGIAVCACAHSGTAAVAAAAAACPDLAILDIEMETARDGIDAAMELRRRYGIPTIFLTAHSDDERFEGAVAAEPLGYVIKPFSAAQLKVALGVADRFIHSRTCLSVCEDRYRRLFDGSPDAVLTVDAELRLTHWNAAAEGMFAAPALTAGAEFDRLLAADGRAEFHRVLKALQGAGGATFRRIISTTGQGTRGAFPAEVAVVLPACAGAAEYSFIIRDLSERRRMIRELDYSRRLCHSVFERAPAIIILYNREGRVVEVNEHFSAVLGLSGAEVVGRPVAELPFLDAAGRRAVSAGVVRCLGGEAGSPYAFEFVTAAGEHRTGSVTESPLRDDDGHVVQGLLIISDVTEFHQAHAALEESTEQYRAIIEGLSEAVHVIDGDYRIVLCNRSMRQLCEALGLDGDLTGRRLQDACPFVTETACEEYRQAFASGQMSTTEEVAVVNGRTVITETRKVPVLDRGHVRRVITVIHDITDRRLAEGQQRRTEERMRQVQKLESLGAMAGGVAHDFNNLLAGILGNTDFALADLRPTPTMRDVLMDIGAAARRAARLSQQMLAFSGHGRLESETVGLSSLVQEMSPLLAALSSKRVQIEYSLDPADPSVKGDPDQLRQMIINLVTNASEAIAGKPGTIHIRTMVVQATGEMLASTYVDDNLARGLYVCLTIEDTGPGMDPATLSRAFDPFFSTRFTGRGLGLPVVLGIIRGHKGAVRIDSDVSRGTTVNVYLPATAAAAACTTASPADAGDWRGEGTVLLVDDEAVVLDMGQRILERLGFRVIRAQSGGEAIAAFERDPAGIRCVVLDQNMPDFGGKEVLDRLLQVDPGAIVILSSGYPLAGGDAVDAGFRDFIQKPYDRRELASCMRRALGGS